MRILVTGAAGTMGVVIGNALVTAGWEVTGCDLRPHAAAAFPITVEDLRDTKDLESLLRGHTALIHLASYASHRLKAPSGLFEANTALDHTIIHAALKAGVKQIVFGSSVQVINGDDGFRDRPPPFCPPYLPLDGAAPPRVASHNPYARAKRATEELLEILARSHPDRSFTVLRFPWVIAPGAREVATRLVHARSRGHDAFAFLPLEETGRLVSAVLRAAPLGYRCYFPAARENLLFTAPAKVIAKYFPDTPLRFPVGQVVSLVHDRALETDTGWIPASVTWPEGRFRAWRDFFQQRPFRRFASRRAKVRRMLARAWLDLRVADFGTARVVLEAQARLGEGPSWDDRAGRLLWVDILAGLVHRLDPRTGENETVSAGQCVSIAVPSSDGRVLVALQESLAWVDFARGSLAAHAGGRFEGPPNRLNDGKCDPAGRLWVGSMSQCAEARTGALFRIEGGGSASRQLEGVACSNGLDWSPDGRTFYYIDSGNRSLEAFDFDLVRGTLSGRRTVLGIPPGLGSPDGACVDREGCVWIALYGGGAVIRVDPLRRRIVGRVAVPASHVTSCAFGGPDLEDLYITTAREGLDRVQLAAQPLAGAIFRARPGARGMPAFRFAPA